MSKYVRYQRPEFKRPYETHPIWRVLGCVLIPVLLVFSYIAAELLVRRGVERGWPIPAGLVGYIHFPDVVWKIPVLSTVCRWIASYPNLPAVLLTFLLFMPLLMGLLSTLYSILYRMVGPPPYTPLDAPPPPRKARSYRR